MTVKELIEQLQQLDPELRVFVRGYEGGYDDAGPISGVVEMALDFHDEWYYGNHETTDYYGANNGDHTIVKGIIL